jgi:hypothetical protein
MIRIINTLCLTCGRRRALAITWINRRVEEGDAAAFQFFKILRLQHQIPAVHRRIFAEDNYLGKDPNSSKANDYTGPATDLLLKLRPNIRYFHSSQYINDLANGDICVAIGWAGVIRFAAVRILAKVVQHSGENLFRRVEEGDAAAFQ